MAKTKFNKRSALINDIDHGGLKMLDIECMIKAHRTMCLKKYIEDYVSPWKILFDFYLGNVGGKFILKCPYPFRCFIKTVSTHGPFLLRQML